MLQVATGRPFRFPVARTNEMTGVLYTNLHLLGRPRIVLEGPSFGKLRQTDEIGIFPKALIYEFIERIEGTESGPSFIVSHGADGYLDNMAVLISFVLRCTCARDAELVRRLTSGERSIGAARAPQGYLARHFEKAVYVQPEEAAEFSQFVEHLLALSRRDFVAVMAAIRIFVTGIRRAGDDVEGAYTLLVAAVEALSAEAAGPTTWESLAANKREALEDALEGADPVLVERVKQAVLAHDPGGLSRAFRRFAAANLPDSFFSEKLADHSHRVGRSELDDLLTSAYSIRSKYVHVLQRLPSMLANVGPNVETSLVGRERMPTLQGLAEMLRRVIMTHVLRLPACEPEPVYYMTDMDGVVQMNLDASAWIWQVEGDLSKHGRVRLEAFLSQLAAALLGQPGAAISDIGELLKKVGEIEGLKDAEALPYLVLHILFNRIAREKSLPLSREQEARLDRLVPTPSPELLVAFAELGKEPPWTIEQHQAALVSYRRKRGRDNGFRVPRLFEAAMALELSERLRKAGRWSEALELIKGAADDYPEHQALRAFAGAASVDSVIDWDVVLRPLPSDPSVQESGKVPDASE